MIENRLLPMPHPDAYIVQNDPRIPPMQTLQPMDLVAAERQRVIEYLAAETIATLRAQLAAMTQERDTWRHAAETNARQIADLIAARDAWAATAQDAMRKLSERCAECTIDRWQALAPKSEPNLKSEFVFPATALRSGPWTPVTPDTQAW